MLNKIKQNATLALPSVLCKIEQKWMFQSHGTLQLPCSLIRTVVLLLHLYLSNGTIWSSFWVLESPSPQLETFPVSLATNNTYAQAPQAMSQLSCQIHNIFQKSWMNHMHMYIGIKSIRTFQVNQILIFPKYHLLDPQVSDWALYNHGIHNPTPPHTWVSFKGYPNFYNPRITWKYLSTKIWQLYVRA